MAGMLHPVSCSFYSQEFLRSMLIVGWRRFADEELNYKERKVAVSKLMQSYLSTMADLGVETWLMHGTLLGWWWNKKASLTKPAPLFLSGINHG